MSFFSDVLRYPAGCTPHGSYHLLLGKLPVVSFHAYDDSIEFRLQGGLAAPFNDWQQSAASVKSLAGLVAPWAFITQKGATQHGVTTVGALGDPIEITAEVDLIGPDSKATARLVRDWIAANERMSTGELAIITQELGRWWVDARWAKTPPDKIRNALLRGQKFTQVWTVDSSFWKSYDSIDNFQFTYDKVVDQFQRVGSDLGDGWDVKYTGTGGGFIFTDGVEAAWVDDPDDPTLTDGRTGTCRKVDFTTDTDNQVISMVIDDFPEWSFPDNAANQLWGRMNTTGDPGTDGILAEFGIGYARLSYVKAGAQYVLREAVMPIPPHRGDLFTLVCGSQGHMRQFTLKRNGLPILWAVEGGTGSLLGSDHRGVGFGMHAGAAVLTQATPATMGYWAAGDNGNVSQSGFVKLTNIGDQPAPPRFTCFGPGTFSFANGPGSTDFVEFGPLLRNQVMQVNSDREQRPVVDMTSIPPAPQELTQYQAAIKDFISFATAGNVAPWLQQIESSFGILPPQGPPYGLLSGSFSNPVPAKSPGSPATPQSIAVKIDGGNADSMIVAAGTPLRRYPL